MQEQIEFLQQQIEELRNRVNSTDYFQPEGVSNQNTNRYYGENEFSGLVFLPNQDAVVTTDGTVTTIALLNLPVDRTVFYQAYVTARRTTNGDAAGYIVTATYKNVAGTVSLIGSVTATYTAETTAGWDCTFDISSNQVRLRATGAAASNIIWHSTIITKSI